MYARLSGRDFGLVRWFSCGAGLGNLLFPWARSVVAAEDYSLPLVWPTWPQISLGLVARGQPPRTYATFFKPTPRYVTGLRKLSLLRSVPRYPEQVLRTTELASSPAMYEFTGMAELFTPIATRHSLIRDRLLEIARDSHVPQARRDPHIAVHVRMGDFSFPRDSRDLDFRNGRVNFRLPIEWYVHTLGLLRKSFGSNMRESILGWIGR